MSIEKTWPDEDSVTVISSDLEMLAKLRRAALPLPYFPRVSMFPGHIVVSNLPRKQTLEFLSNPENAKTHDYTVKDQSGPIKFSYFDHQTQTRVDITDKSELDNYDPKKVSLLG